MIWPRLLAVVLLVGLTQGSFGDLQENKNGNSASELAESIQRDKDLDDELMEVLLNKQSVKAMGAKLLRLQEIAGSQEYLLSFLKDNFVSNGLKYKKNDVLSPFFEGFADLINNSVPKLFFFEWMKDVFNAYCTFCDSTVYSLLKMRRSGATKETIDSLLKALCSQTQLEPVEVCDGVMDLNLDTLIYIIDERPELTSADVCGQVLQEMECQPSVPANWTINIDSGLKVEIPSRPEKGFVNVLQVTDVHIDPEYIDGTTGNCRQPICCTNTSTASGEFNPAGHWGTYESCDTPTDTFKSVLDHMNTQKPDYVYFTGDIISHRVWKTTIETNRDLLGSTYQAFKTKFNDVPVYPVIGNHEPSPLNVFSPLYIKDPALSTQWLYDFLAEKWSSLLPAEALETVRRGGYYTVLVKPGFRIITLNNNVCYVYNWWNLYDQVDPYGQLQWLADTLLAAEKQDEMVHILAHIPPGDSSCLKRYNVVYHQIVQRFSNVIKAQFNGHTHSDDLVVFFSDKEDLQPVNIAFNGGSLNTYLSNNPNYKRYIVDNSDMTVANYETWYFNLTAANQNSNIPPTWDLLYDFYSAYGTSLSNVQDFVVNLASSQDMINKYNRYRQRDSDNVDYSNGCDEECSKKLLCYVSTAEYGNTKHCDKLLEIYGQSKSLN